MRRESHVRFDEGPEVQSPRATRLVVMCRTRKQCEQAEQRIRVILERLGLELHPDKTRRVELFDGKEGFDFLGCHLHKLHNLGLIRLRGSVQYPERPFWRSA